VTPACEIAGLKSSRQREAPGRFDGAVFDDNR